MPLFEFDFTPEAKAKKLAVEEFENKKKFREAPLPVEYAPMARVIEKNYNLPEGTISTGRHWEIMTEHPKAFEAPPPKKWEPTNKEDAYEFEEHKAGVKKSEHEEWGDIEEGLFPGTKMMRSTRGNIKQFNPNQPPQPHQPTPFNTFYNSKKKAGWDDEKISNEWQKMKDADFSSPLSNMAVILQELEIPVERAKQGKLTPDEARKVREKMEAMSKNKWDSLMKLFSGGGVSGKLDE